MIAKLIGLCCLTAGVQAIAPTGAAAMLPPGAGSGCVLLQGLGYGFTASGQPCTIVEGPSGPEVRLLPGGDVYEVSGSGVPGPSQPSQPPICAGYRCGLPSQLAPDGKSQGRETRQGGAPKQPGSGKAAKPAPAKPKVKPRTKRDLSLPECEMLREKAKLDRLITPYGRIVQIMQLRPEPDRLVQLLRYQLNRANGSLQAHSEQFWALNERARKASPDDRPKIIDEMNALEDQYMRAEFRESEVLEKEIRRLETEITRLSELGERLNLADEIARVSAEGKRATDEALTRCKELHGDDY